jgi:hypothetical protein
MTKDTDTPETETEDAPTTLGELDHTNPFTGKAFGATQTYDRGRTIAADGGTDPEREDADAAAGEAEADADADADADREELRDIEHTPPGDAEGTNGVYERGNEGREEQR